MHKRFIALTLGAVVAASALMANTAVAQDTIRIATNVPYKPMEYTTPDGSLTGFDIELGNALCAEAGLDCSWVTQSWNGIIPGLMARKYDAIMSSMQRCCVSTMFRSHSESIIGLYSCVL